MRPLFKINKFRGINDKISPRDLPESSLVRCQNWEIDNVLGNLVIGKGWEQHENTISLGDTASKFIEFRVINYNNVLRQLIYDSSYTLRLLHPSSSTTYLANTLGTNWGIAGSFSDVYFQRKDGNDVVYGGVGNEINNIPFWLGYIKRKRFWTGIGETFAEAIDDYYFKEEECIAPKIGIDPADINLDIVIKDIATSTVGAEGSDVFANTTHYITCSLIYDGYQESPLPTDENGIIYSGTPEWINFSPGASKNEVYFSLYVSDFISERVTGINIYIASGAEAVYGQYNWKLVDTIYIDKTIKGFTSFYGIPLGYVRLGNPVEWEHDGGSKYRIVTRQNEAASGNEYRYYISATRFVNAVHHTDSVGYGVTVKTMPNYKQSIEFDGVRYITNALYPKIKYNSSYVLTRVYDIDDRLSNVVYFSSQGNPNIIPITNYIKVSEPVSALGATNNLLLIFGENSLSIYDTERLLKDMYAKTGCLSHESIASHEGRVYWAGRDGVYVFDRFYPEDITTFAIQKIYQNISDDNKRLSSGVIDVVNKEYVLNIPNYGMLKYNIVTGEWVTRSDIHTFIDEGIEQDLLLLSTGATRYLGILNKTYSFNGTYYTASAMTRPIDLESLDSIIKSITMGYLSYKASGDLSLQIYIDGQLINTIDFDAQAIMKPQQFGMQSNGINGENIQLMFVYTTNSNTIDGEIDFIRLFGDIHEIKGG